MIFLKHEFRFFDEHLQIENRKICNIYGTQLSITKIRCSWRLIFSVNKMRILKKREKTYINIDHVPNSSTSYDSMSLHSCIYVVTCRRNRSQEHLPRGELKVDAIPVDPFLFTFFPVTNHINYIFKMLSAFLKWGKSNPMSLWIIDIHSGFSI